jgi:hypothetical protein
MDKELVKRLDKGSRMVWEHSGVKESDITKIKVYKSGWVRIWFGKTGMMNLQLK